MKNVFPFFFYLLFIATIIGCKREHLVTDRDASTTPGNESISLASKHDEVEWSVPIHLGPEVNSTARELGATLSPDGLSLYFNSDRLGTWDIFVSKRDCIECPWNPAQVIDQLSGPGIDIAPAISHDGHLLFYSSNRGTLADQDLWVSHRQNQNDDFGWETPVNLGPLVNTSDDDNNPCFVGGGEHAELYFNRGGGTFVAPISQHGVLVGLPVPVDLGGDAISPSITQNGRMMVFWAGPSRGSLGGTDIYLSTRQNINDSWSTPVNLGPPVNTSFGGEMEAAISDDGKTLVFSGNRFRGSSLGFTDIWISTRVQH